MNKRFNVHTSSQYIKDDMTGFNYSSLTELCDLLNKVNDRADRNADELYEYKRLMMKYEIRDVKKLDQVLREQRVW